MYTSVMVLGAENDFLIVYFWDFIAVKSVYVSGLEDEVYDNPEPGK